MSDTSDINDSASRLTELFTEEALKIQAEKNKPQLEYQEDEGQLECDECGISIPSQRRRLTGSLLCAECKSWGDYEKQVRKLKGE